MKTRITISILIPIFIFSLYACTTAPVTEDEEPAVTPLPDAPVDLLAETRGMISVASPQTLREVLDELENSPEGSSEAGSELRAAAWFILETVYPLVLPDGSAPELSSASKFNGIFRSVRDGIFPEIVQEDITFLTSLISPIALLYSDSSVVKEQSREVLEQLRMVNNSSVLPVYLLGVLSEMDDDPLSALEYYTGALEMDSSVYPAEIQIAAIQLEGGQPDKAVLILERLNSLFPDSPDILKYLGEAVFFQGDYERAMDIVANTLLLLPDDTELLFLRARILYKAGRYDLARRILSIVEREMPGRRDVLHLKALLEIERNDFDEAVIILERSLEIYPDDPGLKNSYGEVLISMGRLEEGRKLLSEQISVDESDETSEKSLEILLTDAVSSGLWSKAREYSDRILEKRRGKDDLLLAREIAMALGDQDSVNQFEIELYDDYPLEPDVEEIYLRSLISRGEYNQARTILLVAIEREEGFSRRSMLYFLLSVTSESESERIDYLRSALLEDLENSEALIDLSKIYYNRRDYRNAHRYIKQAYLLDPADEELRKEVERLEDLLP